MADHDPLCRWPTVIVKANGPVDGVEFAGCDCDLIRRVRADEMAALRDQLGDLCDCSSCRDTLDDVRDLIDRRIGGLA